MPPIQSDFVARQHPLPLRYEPRFSALPDELLLQIFNHFDNAADIFHVQLTNHKNHGPATETLYKQLELVVTSDMSDAYKRFFNSCNAGHSFVRKLLISLDVCHLEDPRSAYQYLSMLLDRLPPNRLSHFRYLSHRPLPHRLFRELWQTQSQLKNLELLPSIEIDTNMDSSAPDPHIGLNTLLRLVQFDRLESIRVVPEGPATGALCSLALQKVKPGAVTSLEIDTRHWEDTEDFEDFEDTDDNVHVKDQLVESLFAHIERQLPGHKGHLDNLTTLVLRDVTNLHTSKHTWFTYLSLSKLQHLQLEHCPHADLFLLQLFSGANIPTLKSLRVVQDLMGQPNRLMEAIEQVLRDTGNEIEHLELCLRQMPKLPTVDAIARHGSSLCTLLLDIQDSSWSSSPPLVYGETDFETLLKPCMNLTELAIALPEIGLEYDEFPVDTFSFGGHFKMIAQYCQLTALSILNFPRDYIGDRSAGFYATKDAALCRMAADMFTLRNAVGADTSVAPAFLLNVIALGTRERNPIRLGPRFFVPIESKVLRKTMASAALVSLTDLRKSGLAASVLNYERRDFDLESRKVFHAVEKEGDDYQGQREGEMHAWTWW